MWSGGIDSTVVVVSFLMLGYNLDNIIILLTPESIKENPTFFYKEVLPKFKIETSLKIFDILGDDDKIIISGELNDQLFGSDVILSMINNYGIDFYNKKFTIDELYSYNKMIISDDKIWTDLMIDLSKICPSGIISLGDFYWWFNFTCKWQGVYTRLLAYVNKNNSYKLNKTTISEKYICFFNSNEFQNWAVWNKDKKIKDVWSSYKLESKKIIFDFTKDEHFFKNKCKRGSLGYVILQQNCVDAIDDNYVFYDNLNISNYYVSNNSFQ